MRCHGPEKVERDLRIDQLSRDFQAGADGHLWAEIVERINAGELPRKRNLSPPKTKPRPLSNNSMLSLSPSHVERYYRAAEIVLSRAFSEKPVEARTIRRTAADIRYNGGKTQQVYLDRFGIKRPLRSLIFPGRVQQALSPNWFGKTGPEHSGLYRAKMQASGIRPQGGQPAHLRIGKQTGEAANEGLIEQSALRPVRCRWSVAHS